MSWSGWIDDASGIKQYEIEFYKMIAYGESLAYRTQSPSVTATLPKGTTQYVATLPEIGLNLNFSLVMYVSLDA